MAKQLSKNQKRINDGEKQIGRHIGTTIAKKPMFKKEYERLVNATHKSTSIKSTSRPKLSRAFTLLYLTGCRASEIINLHTKDLEQMILNNEFSLKNNTKTKKARLISFDTNLKQVEYLKNILPADDIYLFAKNNSKQCMSVESLKVMMNRFIHKVLGELYSTHSFRTGYITTAHKIGLSLEHIRKDIGHSSITTTARYATVTSEEIAESKNTIQW